MIKCNLSLHKKIANLENISNKKNEKQPGGVNFCQN